jgi:hypothetical protein
MMRISKVNKYEGNDAIDDKSIELFLYFELSFDKFQNYSSDSIQSLINV